MDWAQALIPALIGFGGIIIGWFSKVYFENKVRNKEKVEADLAEIYLEIISPFIELLSNPTDPTTNQNTLIKLRSVEYRKASFQLVIRSPKNVLAAWNKFWQNLYSSNSNNVSNPSILLDLGQLLLEIRKGLGLQDAGVNKEDMIKWLFNNFDQLFSKK